MIEFYVETLVNGPGETEEVVTLVVRAGLHRGRCEDELLILSIQCSTCPDQGSN
jgi:hypothetical protein